METTVREIGERVVAALEMAGYAELTIGNYALVHDAVRTRFTLGLTDGTAGGPLWPRAHCRHWRIGRVQPSIP